VARKPQSRSQKALTQISLTIPLDVQRPVRITGPVSVTIAVANPIGASAISTHPHQGGARSTTEHQVIARSPSWRRRQLLLRPTRRRHLSLGGASIYVSQSCQHLRVQRPRGHANPSVSVATAPTHTPVANPADADATVITSVGAIIVGRRRVTVAHVTVTTRCKGCGGSSSRISIACTPASCGLGAPKGKKRRCDRQAAAIVRMRI